ncbi:response regulator [Amycolatopsis suaedae]|uniref:histidine kinase n=2 Tax=Amycolatopsis suaedae TaxID=2510978 RepID=A0A4Q7J0K4_9PSEU|nr:response regulator [Amycolatopsis suaedae]
MRAKDWASTPLGPVESWPVELRAAVRTVLPSRIPMLLWWGPELIQIFNEAYTPLLGDKFPDAAGQPAARCWSEVWDQLGPLAEQVLGGGGATYSEEMHLLLRRHGYLEETYWTFSYSPVHSEDGTVAGIFVATNDVTARTLAHRRLESLRQLGTLSLTGADTITDAARAAVTVLSGSADLPGVVAYLRPDGTEDRLELVAAYGDQADTPPDTLRKVARTGQAERVAGSVVLPLVVSGQAEPIGVLAVGVSPYRELDEFYRVFLDLVAARVSAVLGDALAYTAQRTRASALAELDAAKTRFFQNVSHEFRTPLTLLLGPLRTVLDRHADVLPADQRDGLAAAYQAALRLQRLVDALLDVARAEADELHARREPTDVAALTAECASMFRAVAERNDLRLRIAVDGAAGATVALDREMWAKIVLNLLSNAVKFTPSGSVTLTLDVTGDDVTLTVADTGVGIPDVEQDRIFDRFHQVAGTRGRSREGAGIGLALVADLAAALGGRVTVASVPRQGSTFTVTVPRIAAVSPNGDLSGHDVAAKLAPAFLGEARQWEPAGTTEPRDGTRVLVVEDNADMRDYLARLMDEQGWLVDLAGDVDTALALIGAKPPDLVVSDVMLPGRDGLDLLRQLRADPRLVRLPVVLLTARAGPESAVEGLRHGADDYVVKPFHPVELIARVRVHLELSRLRETVLESSEREAEQLRAALDSRSVLSQAVGLLMATHRVDADTAFRQLVALSQHRNRKAREIAAEIVADFTAGLAAQQES